MTLQYAGADNVKSYTTINITAASLGFPTDRPAKLNWVRCQFSCSYDAPVTSKSYVPLIQFEAKAPSGNENPRMLFRSPPSLVPQGFIKSFKYRIPNSGFYQYSDGNTVVLTMIISSSDSLCVTFNLFVNLTFDFRSYQGLSLFPPSNKRHETHRRDHEDDEPPTSSFSALSLTSAGGRRGSI